MSLIIWVDLLFMLGGADRWKNSDKYIYLVARKVSLGAKLYQPAGGQECVAHSTQRIHKIQIMVIVYTNVMIYRENVNVKHKNTCGNLKNNNLQW